MLIFLNSKILHSLEFPNSLSVLYHTKKDKKNLLNNAIKLRNAEVRSKGLGLFSSGVKKTRSTTLKAGPRLRKRDKLKKTGNRKSASLSSLRLKKKAKALSKDIAIFLFYFMVLLRIFLSSVMYHTSWFNILK